MLHYDFYNNYYCRLITGYFGTLILILKPYTLMLGEIATLIKEVTVLIKALFKMSYAGKQLQKVRDIYGEMTNLVENTPVQRFVILKAENGGGVIKPGVHLYASLIYEMYRAPVKSHIREYQRILLDPSYINILVQTIQKSGISIETTSLEEKSILKAIYQAEGVKYSELYFIKNTKKAFYYCSISTTEDNEKFDDYKDRLAITLAINKIKALMK